MDGAPRLVHSLRDQSHLSRKSQESVSITGEVPAPGGTSVHTSILSRALLRSRFPQQLLPLLRLLLRTGTGRLGLLEGACRYPQAALAPPCEHFSNACVASIDLACPVRYAKKVSFGDTEKRVITSSFGEEARFEPVTRERNLNYSWPEEIRGLNSARERRRA